MTPFSQALSSFVIVTVAVPSVVCAGTSSVDDGVNVSVNVSLFSTDVSSIVEIATVLDVSPLAKDTVVLMAVQSDPAVADESLEVRVRF